MESLRYKTAIVGASETTELGNIPDKTPFQLHVDASVNAIKDCGIDKQEIDGIATTMNPASLAHYLGITPKWIDNTQVGGTSFLIHVRHAAAAIASGLCETVLVSMAESGRSRVGDTSLSTFSEPTLEKLEFISSELNKSPYNLLKFLILVETSFVVRCTGNSRYQPAIRL